MKTRKASRPVAAALSRTTPLRILMNRRFFTCLLGLGTFFIPSGRAQYWETDAHFEPVLESASSGYSNPTLEAAPGGKLLVSGVYAVNGVRASEVRLNTDGSIDPSFDVEKEGSVGVLARYADGRVLAIKQTGDTAHLLRRLTPDRSDDPSFTPVVLHLGRVRAHILSDGRVLLWGSFFAINGAATNNLAMLDPDGTVSSEFSSPFTSPVMEGDLGSLFVAPTSDGKFFAVGPLGDLAGPPSSRIIRVLADGRVDPTFDASAVPFPSLAQRAYPQPDGRVLVSYAPGWMAGADAWGILRLNADGTFDPTFAPEFSGAQRYFGAQQSDGRIFYTSYDANNTSVELRRMNPDGTTDPTFVVRAPTGAGVGFSLGTVVPADDGTYFFASPLTVERHASGLKITRVFADGTIDPNFNPRIRGAAVIDAFARQSDGKILAAGRIGFANGEPVGDQLSIIRLNADGSLDPTFKATLGATETVARLRTQPDGKVVASGQFLNGTQTRSYLRFNADGSRDTAFTLPGVSSTQFEVDELGRIYALINSGSSGYGQLERYTVAGVLDAGFKRATLGIPNLFGVWPDSRVIIATENPSGTGQISLTRLDANGNVDPGFTIDPRALPDTLLALVPIPDGRVVAIGHDVWRQSEIASYTRFGPSGVTEYRYRAHASISPNPAEAAGVLFDALRAGSLPVAARARVDFVGEASVEVEGTGRSTAWSISTSAGSLNLTVARRTSLTGPSVDPTPAANLPSHTNPQTLLVGGTATLSVVGGGMFPLAYQWQKDGVAIPGANASELTLPNFAPADIGVYAVVVSNDAGAVVSQPMAMGALSTTRVSGEATEVGPDIRHPNGRTMDQILLEGEAAMTTADFGETTRLSYIDLDDDIVQVEFTGAGTLAIRLDAATGPAAPVRYVQPGVAYMKGHATIVVTGANETTNLSVFSVGRANAVDQSLFRDDVTYDGVADLARIVIIRSSGDFGGLRCANVNFFATEGFTGIYAPAVVFRGPVYVGDLSAFDDAEPVLLLGVATGDTLVAGGDLFQANGRAVQVGGITQLEFVAGTTSHGIALPAQANQARLERDGVDVTAQIVVNP